LRVAGLCVPGASLEVVFTYDPLRDARAVGLPKLTEEHMQSVIPAVYRTAGVDLRRVERLSAQDVVALPTTWARRLGYGRPRPVWRLYARYSG
jgi:hypothetical protein